MPTLEEMRAEINRLLPDVQTPQFVKNIQTAYQNMPGAAIPQAALSLGSNIIGAPLGAAYGVARNLLSDKFGTQEGIQYGQQEAKKVMDAMRYTPPTKAGREIVEGIETLPQKITGSHMGFGMLPEIWGMSPRISPSDVQVMGARGINAAREIGNIPRDFSAAQSGLTRLNAYNEPTYGARMQNVAQDIGDVMARRQAMRSEEGAPVLSGFGTFTDLVPDPRMYAVKPKGGNWPTTLGSTLPLKEQGVFGKHLSESQLKEGGDNVLDLFKKQLRNFYPRAVDNRELLNDWEDFSTKYDSDVDYDITGELADQFVEKINAKNLSLDPNAKQLKSISDLQKIIPAYNSWIMGNYQKYIRDLMGTGIEFDPMLQEIEKANIPLKDLFEERYSLDDNMWKDIAIQRRSERRQNSPRDLNLDLQDPLNKNIGIQTAQTEPGKMFEDYIDAALGLRSEYTFPRSQYPAMTAILDRNKNARINDLILDNL